VPPSDKDKVPCERFTRLHLWTHPFEDQGPQSVQSGSYHTHPCPTAH